MSEETEEYICSVCKQAYKKEVSDEEAMAESVKLFGAWPKEELVIVCDDCHKEMMSFFGRIK